MYPGFHHYYYRLAGQKKHKAQAMRAMRLQIQAQDNVAVSDRTNVVLTPLTGSLAIHGEAVAILTVESREPSKLEHRLLRGATLVGYMLPGWAREEWVGDFKESMFDLARSKPSRWKLVLTAIGRFALLLWALSKVKLHDLVSSGTKKRSSD